MGGTRRKACGAAAVAIAAALIGAAVGAQERAGADVDNGPVGDAPGRPTTDGPESLTADPPKGPTTDGLEGPIAEIPGGRATDARAPADLRTCLEIAADDARLACFEAVARQQRAPSTGPSPPATVPNGAVGAVHTPADAAHDAKIVVVDIRRPRIGPPRFVAADGRVFLQTSTQPGRFPPVPFEAVLRPAVNGSLFLVSPRGGPNVRVSPID